MCLINIEQCLQYFYEEILKFIPNNIIKKKSFHLLSQPITIVLEVLFVFLTV